MVEFNKNSYGSTPGILAFPDHYVAVAQKFTNAGISADSYGRKIIHAGTIYPSNDANAIGVVMSDMDVTRGDQTGALLIHGFVKTPALPALPSANAKTALKGIFFMPLYTVTDVTLSATKLSLAAADYGDADMTVSVDVALNNGTYRDAATTKTNWTITGEATTKFALDTVVLSADKRVATLTFKTSAAAAAGTNTATVAAACVSSGVAPDAAVDVLVVA